MSLVDQDEVRLRVECVKLASVHCREPEDITALAAQLFDFIVTGKVFTKEETINITLDQNILAESDA